MIKTSADKMNAEGHGQRKGIKRPMMGLFPVRVTRTPFGIGLQDLREDIRQDEGRSIGWKRWSGRRIHKLLGL